MIKTIEADGTGAAPICKGEAMSKVYSSSEQVTTKKAPYLHYRMWHRKQEEYSQQLLV